MGSPNVGDRFDHEPPDLGPLRRRRFEQPRSPLADATISTIVWSKNLGHPASEPYADAFRVTHRVRENRYADGPGSDDPNTAGWRDARRAPILQPHLDQGADLAVPLWVFFEGMARNYLQIELADLDWVDPPLPPPPLMARHVPPSGRIHVNFVTDGEAAAATLVPIRIVWHRLV